MSRPRAPAPPPPPVIQRPELAGRRRRLGYALLTLLAWLVWAYLWLPLVSLLAWLAGIRLFRQEVLLAPNTGDSLSSLLWFLAVVVVAALIYTGWAQYNLHRFRGKDRRRPVPDLADADAAAFFRLPPEDLRQLRRSSRLVVHVDPHGHPAAIATDEAPEG